MLTHLAMLTPVWSAKVPFDVVGAGSLMLITITLIHGAGLDRIVDHYRKRSQILLERACRPHLARLLFAWAVLLMLLLHIAELVIWGVVLNMAGLIPNLRDSIYFSANTYTTVGYGGMILPVEWRELTPIIAISGVFTFALTTGQIFELVGHRRLLGERLASLHRGGSVPRTAKRDEEPIKAKAAAMEQDLAKREDQRVASLSPEQRHELWKEIEAKLQRLHEAENYELTTLRNSGL
jgi:hypothetical protein